MESGKRKRDIKTLLWYAGVIAVGVLISLFVVAVVKVDGSSMEPTLHHGDWMLVQKITKPKRGDIIVIKSDNGANMVKRVIGLAGDTIEVTYDALYVNGALIDNRQNSDDESYQETITVPDNAIYVLGDNRLESYDSREMGCVSSSDVIGVVIEFF